MKSFKGKEVDVSLIMENNSKVIAAGNMRVNARGDLLGRGGKILKTREQLENEYFQKNPDAVKKREENSVGFNKDFANFRDNVLKDEMIREEDVKPTDPYKETAKHNPNLSTSNKETVKFTDLVPPQELAELPLEDEFEISDEPTPKKGKK